MERGEYGSAIKDYSRAIELNAENTVALARRGMVDLERRHFQEAASDLARARQIHLRLADHFGRQPDATFGTDSEGNRITGHDKAAVEYEKAAELKPFLDRISSNLETGESKKRNTSPSPRNLDREAAPGLENFDYYYHEGTVNLQYGSYGRAVRNFDKAIELNPKHAESHCNRALASVQRGHYNKAIEFFERAVAIDAKVASEFVSDIGPAYFQRGVAIKEKSPEAATESIEIAIKLRQDIAAGETVRRSYFRFQQIARTAARFR